jgi:hypothetical protein
MVLLAAAPWTADHMLMMQVKAVSCGGSELSTGQ